MTSTISLTDTYALTVSDSPDSEQTPWATLRDVTYPQAIDYTCYISRNWTGPCTLATRDTGHSTTRATSEARTKP